MPNETIKRIPITRMCIENEKQLHEQGPLGHDFIDMSPEAIKLRELVDHLGEISVIVAGEDDAACDRVPKPVSDSV